MKDIIIKYTVIIIWSIIFYFLGIFIKFQKYNIFESHLFISLLSICCLLNSSYFMNLIKIIQKILLKIFIINLVKK